MQYTYKPSIPKRKEYPTEIDYIAAVFYRIGNRRFYLSPAGESFGELNDHWRTRRSYRTLKLACVALKLGVES